VIQRCAEMYEDIDSFFDRWQHMLGVALIEEPPAQSNSIICPDSLTPALTPPQVIKRDELRSMTILCDGTIPHGDIANFSANSLKAAWQQLVTQRQTAHGTAKGKVA